MGLRESKKLHTRQEIADKAMQLFAVRGFDRVTVAEVAAAAGVSEKTVFNYFPTKEDLFFDEVPRREAALVEAISGREPGESILSALRRLQTGECGRLCTPGFAAFARIIEESPALQAKELEVMARFVHVRHRVGGGHDLEPAQPGERRPRVLAAAGEEERREDE